MTAYLTHRNIAFALAVLIGLGAFAGSARELWRIAETAEYGLPVGLVAALDGLAVVCVIVLSSRRDWQALATLVAATFLSIGLQVLAVPRELVVDGVTKAVPADRYISAVLVHALVPLASFMAVHLATRLDRPGQTTAAKPRPKPAPKPATKPAPPVGIPSPGRAPEVPATPLRPAASAVAGRRPTLDELVALAVKVAESLDVHPSEMSRRQLQDGLKDLDPPVGIGTAKAGAVLEVLKRNRLAELQTHRINGTRPADLMEVAQ